MHDSLTSKLWHLREDFNDSLTMTNKHVRAYLSALIAPLAFFGSIDSVSAQASPLEEDNQIKLFPDWSQITFSNFEPIAQGGRDRFEAQI